VAGLNLAHTFLFTTRGTPLIYSGDEIGMPGGGDPDNRRDFPGGGAADPRNAFDAQGRTSEQQAVFLNVQRLARLRRALPALQSGRLVTLFADEQAWAYVRQGPGMEAVLVLINNDVKPVRLEVGVDAVGFRDGALEERLGEGGLRAAVLDGRVTVTVEPRSARIYTQIR
jgi:glycosidase